LSIFAAFSDYFAAAEAAGRILKKDRSFYISARKAPVIKPGDEWHPERSGFIPPGRQLCNFNAYILSALFIVPGCAQA
jgi:hypothetical protein